MTNQEHETAPLEESHPVTKPMGPCVPSPLDTSASPESAATQALAATRAALRREIGPPSGDRDREWQPMVSAAEVRQLLDALDTYLSPADVERAVAAAKAEALREAAGELWRVFLRLPHTPSPLGDYLQRRVVALREHADHLAADPGRRTEPDVTVERSPEEQLLWDIFAKPLEHQLLGSACSCGEWSAGCGGDVPGQWADHLRSVERRTEGSE